MLLDVLRNTSGRSQGFEDREVVPLPLDGGAQEANAFSFGADDEVLPGVTLLLARIVVLLFVLVLGPLDGTLCPVNEDFSGFGEGSEEILNVLELPFGQDQLFPEDGFQNTAQGELPTTGVGPITPIEERQDIVGGIAFVVEKDKEQFVGDRGKKTFSSTSIFPLPLWIFPVGLLFSPMQGFRKGRHQPGKLIGGEAG